MKLEPCYRETCFFVLMSTFERREYYDLFPLIQSLVVRREIKSTSDLGKTLVSTSESTQVMGLLVLDSVVEAPLAILDSTDNYDVLKKSEISN